MCGEKDKGKSIVQAFPGSPPHVRGKGPDSRLQIPEYRITPACAGKSLFLQCTVLQVQDHPRMCGEKISAAVPFVCCEGSPPHVRGKVEEFLRQRFQGRITPACAGKRLKRSRSTVPHAAIVPLFPSVCNKPAGSDGSPAGHDAPPFLPIENAAPASPAYNLRSL